MLHTLVLLSLESAARKAGDHGKYRKFTGLESYLSLSALLKAVHTHQASLHCRQGRPTVGRAANGKLLVEADSV